MEFLFEIVARDEFTGNLLQVEYIQKRDNILEKVHFGKMRYFNAEDTLSIVEYLRKQGYGVKISQEWL